MRAIYFWLWLFSREFICIMVLRIQWGPSSTLKTSKKCMKQYFLICKNVYILIWKFIQCTIHWNKTQMLKRFSSDKINATQNAFLLFLKAPIYHSFTFNFWFLYELKHKICLSKTVCEIIVIRNGKTFH